MPIGSAAHSTLTDLPIGAHYIAASGRVKIHDPAAPDTRGAIGAKGVMFDNVIHGSVIKVDKTTPADHPNCIWQPIYGLSIDILGEPAENVVVDPVNLAATVELTVGEQFRGNCKIRRFTVNRQGVWIVARGWGVAKLRVLDVQTSIPNTEIGYTWTTRPPVRPTRLHLVEAITAGTRAIPQGAVRVAAAIADAGWLWTTEVTPGTPLSIPNPQPGAGAIIDVLGATYTATAPNVLNWFLEPV